MMTYVLKIYPKITYTGLRIMIKGEQTNCSHQLLRTSLHLHQNQAETARYKSYFKNEPTSTTHCTIFAFGKSIQLLYHECKL